jgi:hypothetical protein|tara:strand:- start:4751 stop:5611 length:861 start_codon:yes stop_codon:yes gene_type:complete
MKRETLIKTLFGCILLLMGSCNRDEELSSMVLTESDAIFTFSEDVDDPNTIHFSADPSIDTWFTHWSFGDGSSSDGLETSKTYYTKGEYEVRFKIFTTSGEAYSYQTISIANDLADESNLVKNGTFDDASSWNIVNHYDATNLEGVVTIADGVAHFTEQSNTWKHMGIYQSIALQPGTYQFDMDITYSEINEIWGEVWLGLSEPINGNDYNTDNSAEIILNVFNAWDCSSKITYSGKATALGCDSNPNPGNFTLSVPGVYYLIFRTGGAQYGTNGIVVDNIELREE